MPKETDLVISSSISGTDEVRVVISGSSRRVTMNSLASALKTLLEALGVYSSANPPSASARTHKIVEKSSTYTATTSDEVILVDASGGAVTINLPTAASAYDSGNTRGNVYFIKKNDSSSNIVTIDPNSTELVDGAGTFQLFTQNDYVVIISDGTEWWVI